MTLIHLSLGDLLGDRELAEDEYTISGNIMAFRDSTGRLVTPRLGWDKAHNYMVDLGLTAGIPSVALFLVFLVAGQVALWRSGSPLKEGVAVGWISFMVFGLAWFGTISLDPVIWVLVGAGLGAGVRNLRTSS